MFTFKLSFSGWSWVRVAFGETFEALVKGVQGALSALGGVPEFLRHDNLSAATHELKRSGGRALTERFRGVVEHYGLRSTRIRPGESHENGVGERAHDLIKRELAQALVLRGSRDFDDLDALSMCDTSLWGTSADACGSACLWRPLGDGQPQYPFGCLAV
ncbi:MAG TPA: hypothetical protein VJ725_05440 [Thermoanaerobaculia bacterium]|nr:hypothetical protein [Thermoanaerobaculia bacterium]